MSAKDDDPVRQPESLTQKQLTIEVFKLLHRQDEARNEAATAQAVRDEAQAARDEAMLATMAKIAALLPAAAASPPQQTTPVSDHAEAPPANVADDTEVPIASEPPPAAVPPPAAPPPLPPPMTQHWKALPIPAALEPGVSLRAYEDWRTAWDEYAISANIHLMPPDKQTVHLRRCISSDLKSILTHSLGATLDSGLSIEETLNLIDQHMRGQRNVAVRQQEFNLYRQQQDQTFDAFFSRLKQLAKDADLCLSCLDTRLATAIITGLRDRQLAEQLQSQEPALTLDQILSKCRALESAKKSNAEFKGQPAAMKKN